MRALSTSHAPNAERSRSGDAKNVAGLDAHTSVQSAASPDRRYELTQVLVSIKIFPSDAPADMTALKDKVRKTLEGKATIYKYEEEPVAFGLVALVAHVLVPEEAQGRMDEVEELLKGVKGVSEVQVMVSRRIA